MRTQVCEDRSIKPTTIYLVLTDISGLGIGYQAYRSLPKAVEAAHASVKMFVPKHKPIHIKETAHPRHDPTCHLQLTWGADVDNAVTVIETSLS